MTDIKQQVNKILKEMFEIPEEKLRPESHFRDDLALDSLDAVDLLVLLEKELGQPIDGQRFIQIQTLGDIYSVLEELVGEIQGGKAKGGHLNSTNTPKN